jgi:hypothetical protein
VLYVEYTYILLGNVPHDPTTLKAHHPKAWWKPVFQLMFLTIVSFAVFTRIARHKAFWVCVLGYITFASIYGTFIFALCKIKTK